MDDLFLLKLEELKEQKLAVATITKTFGSTLGKAGFKMIITSGGEIAYGTLGGGCPEGPIVRVGLDVIKTQIPRVVKVFLEDAKTALGKISVSDDGDEVHVETNSTVLLKEHLLMLGRKSDLRRWSTIRWGLAVSLILRARRSTLVLSAFLRERMLSWSRVE